MADDEVPGGSLKRWKEASEVSYSIKWESYTVHDVISVQKKEFRHH